MLGLSESLSCCIWWLLFGVLIGWLCNWWLCKCSCKTNQASPAPKADATAPAPAISKIADTDVKAPVSNLASNINTAPTAPPKAAMFDLAAAKAAGFSIKHANDLTVVEGIGPKISELFKANGINTYTDLAQQPVSQLRRILDTGGARFRIANPETWAQQAALAAENKWSELKKLQDSLSGGVKK